MEPESDPKSGGNDAGPSAALDQTYLLLRAKDDTSRFVGLSLLHSVLDSQQELREDAHVISRSWDSIPKSFLVRLLRASETRTTNREDARNTRQLAVAVIHTFANILPPAQLEKKEMTDLCEPLILAVSSSIDTTSQMLVFQAVQCIANTPGGAKAFVSAAVSKNELVNLASNDERILQQLCKTLSIAYNSLLSSAKLLPVWEEVVISLLDGAKTQPEPIMEMLTDVTNSSDASSTAPSWLEPVLNIVKVHMVKRATSRMQNASIMLIGSLLNNSSPQLNLPLSIFRNSAHSSQNFSQLFITIILIDIRSTIPSLMESLAAPSYPSIALRLAAGYDIVVAFLHVLLQIVKDDEDMVENSAEPIMSPALLLKLRGDLTETMSMTMEYLRDRWDASVAGAPGLHPDARAPRSSTSNTPLLLTWDNPSVSPSNDPITLAGLRALSIWLREDENPTLQEQALAIIDIMLELYSASNQGGEVDFRPPILAALYALLRSSDTAVQDFLHHEGWSILSSDLLSGLSDMETVSLPVDRAQDIVLVLLAVVESDFVPMTREAWMDLIATLVQSYRRHHPLALDLSPTLDSIRAAHDILAVYQLSVALILKAPKRLQPRLKDDVKFIIADAGQISTWASAYDQDVGKSAGEIIGALQEL